MFFIKNHKTSQIDLFLMSNECGIKTKPKKTLQTNYANNLCTYKSSFNILLYLKKNFEQYKLYSLLKNVYITANI